MNIITHLKWNCLSGEGWVRKGNGHWLVKFDKTVASLTAINNYWLATNKRRTHGERRWWWWLLVLEPPLVGNNRKQIINTERSVLPCLACSEYIPNLLYFSYKVSPIWTRWYLTRPKTYTYKNEWVHFPGLLTGVNQ